MNPEKSCSGRVTFSSSLFVAVDDRQSMNERLDLTDVMFDLCFGVSYIKFVCTRRTKGKPLSFGRLFNTIIFCSPLFVE